MLTKNRRAFILGTAGTLAMPAILTFSRAGAQTQPAGNQPLTIARAIAADQRLTRFAALLGRTGADRKLAEEGQWTVFAPTDAAFNWLPGPLVDSLENRRGADNASVDSSRTESVALQHIVAFRHASSELSGHTEEFKALNGGRLSVNGQQNPMLVSTLSTPGVLSAPGANMPGPAKIVAADNFASNGVLHIVDNVLLP